MLAIPFPRTEDFEQLVALCGGRKMAAKILGVPVSDVDSWLQGAPAPQLALRLLWLGGPMGQEAIATDLHVRARMAEVCVEALRRESTATENQLLRQLRDAEDRLAAAERQLDAQFLADRLGSFCRRLSSELEAASQTVDELNAFATSGVRTGLPLPTAAAANAAEASLPPINRASTGL